MSIVNALIRWSEEQGLPCDVSFAGDIAIFSAGSRKHRYVLTRRLGEESRVLAVIGLNPSTATAFQDDPTIRRLKGYAKRWACGTLVMLNAHGYRATDPKDMAAANERGEDIVGADNDAAIAFVLAALARHRPAPSELVLDNIALAAWGGNAHEARAMHILGIARDLNVRLQCLGTNQDGSPKHPLYLKKTAPWKPWPEVEA